MTIESRNLDVLHFADIGADPTIAGEEVRNGARKKFHDGAIVQTIAFLSDIGGGGSPTRFVTFKVDGGEAPLLPGFQDFIFVGFAGTISAWVILADAPGDIKIDIWKCVYADYPPSDEDSICGGHEPEIAAADKDFDDDLEDWDDTALAIGDILKFNIVSSDLIKKVTLMLICEPT